MIQGIYDFGSGILVYITKNGGKILASGGQIGKDVLNNIYNMGLMGIANNLTAPLVNYFLETVKHTYTTFWYNVAQYNIINAPNTVFYIKQYMKMNLGKINNKIRFYEIGGRQDYDYIDGSYKIYDEKYGNVVFQIQGNIITISVLRKKLMDGSDAKLQIEYNKTFIQMYEQILDAIVQNDHDLTPENLQEIYDEYEVENSEQLKTKIKSIINDLKNDKFVKYANEYVNLLKDKVNQEYDSNLKRINSYHNRMDMWQVNSREIDLNNPLYNNIKPKQQQIIDKIKSFLNGEYKSHQNCLSFLLYGGPGKGKTTTAILAAAKLILNHYQLNIDRFNTQFLEGLFRGIISNSIVVVDEYDKLDRDKVMPDTRTKLHTILNNPLVISQKVVVIFTSNTFDFRQGSDDTLFLNGRITEIYNFDQ